MMNFEKVFNLIAEKFEGEGIDFALVGGLALHFFGVSRNTFDVDFIVLSRQSEKVGLVMRDIGYHVSYQTPEVANYISDDLELGWVDFIFAHRKYALQMLEHARVEKLWGKKVKVIRPEDMIGLKVQSSSNDPRRYLRDMSDIEEIIEKNGHLLDWKLIEEYFRMFNRAEELKGIVGKYKNETY